MKKREKEIKSAELPEAEGWEALIGGGIVVVGLILGLLWPAVAVKAAIVTASWILRDWMVSGTVVLAAGLLGTWLVWRRQPASYERGRVTKRVFGIAVRWESGKTSRWVRCRYCTGGRQWLSPRGWGKIPRAIRLTVEDRVGTRLANAKNCPVCHGMGHHWKRESG